LQVLPFSAARSNTISARRYQHEDLRDAAPAPCIRHVCERWHGHRKCYRCCIERVDSRAVGLTSSSRLTEDERKNRRVHASWNDGPYWNYTRAQLGSEEISQRVQQLEDKLTLIDEHFNALEDLDSLDAYTAGKKMKGVSRIHQGALKDVEYLDGGVHACSIPEKYPGIKHGIQQAGPTIEARRAENERIQKEKFLHDLEMMWESVLVTVGPWWNLGVQKSKIAWDRCLFIKVKVQRKKCENQV
jgi:hypothetical protein